MSRPFLLGLIPLVFVTSRPESCLAQSPVELISKSKRATALVVIKSQEGRGFGTAFCIDKSGIFVTNAHVVDDAVEGGSVKLVLNVGLPDQRVAQARLLRSDQEHDLALLKIDSTPDLVELELGKDNELVETAEVTILGFPFGDQLALRADGFPDVSVNTSRITALRKDRGELALVQVDGLLNPGNSGGPVVDKGGRVVGVVAAGVLGRGINFAVPVGRLVALLESPQVVFNPPDITYASRAQSVDWTIQLKPALRNPRPLATDLRVSVTLDVEGQPPRSIPARALRDDIYKLSLRPVPNDSGRTLSLIVTIGGQTDRVVIPDQALKINKRPGMLSDLRQILGDAPPRALTASGRWITGPISGLGKVKLRKGRETITVDLNKATRIEVEAMTDAPIIGQVGVMIEIKAGTSLVATERRTLKLEGAPVMTMRPPQGAVRPPVVVRVPDTPDTSVEELVDIGGTLDISNTKPQHAGGSIRTPAIAIPEARVSLPSAAPPEDLRISIPRVQVLGVAFSPDSRLVAAGGDDGAVHLFDPDSGLEVRRIAVGGHIEWVTFSPDGRRILATAKGKGMSLWDVETGRPVLRYATPGKPSDGCGNFSSDGRLILAQGDDNSLRLYDAATGKNLRIFRDPTSFQFMFSDSNRHALSYFWDTNIPGGGPYPYRATKQVIRMRDVENAEEVWRLDLPDGPYVDKLALVPGTNQFLTVGGDGHVVWRDLKDGRELRQIDLGSSLMYAVAATTPDGRRLLTGHPDQKLRLWDLAEGKEIYRVPLETRPQKPPVISPDGRTAAIGSTRGNLRLLRLPASEDPGAALVRQLPAPITDVAVGGAGRYLLLTLREARTLAIFDVNAADIVKRIPLASKNVLVAAGAEKFVLVFPEEKLIQRWDLSGLSREASLPLPIQGMMNVLTMGSDSAGPLLAQWSDERRVGRVSHWFSFIDLDTLKVLRVKRFSSEPQDFTQRQRIPGGALSLGSFARLSDLSVQVRASADGKLFGLWRLRVSPAGFQTLRLEATTVQANYEHESYGSLLPDADGRLFYTGLGGVRDSLGKPTLRTADPNAPKPIYLPSSDPLYYLGVDGLSGHSRSPSTSPSRVSIAIHVAGNETPLITLGQFREMDEFMRSRDGRQDDLPLDRRFHWVPSANLLITIPPSDDRLVLRRCDVEKLLAARGGDYLLVLSPGALAAKAGEELSHQIRVKSKQGKVTHTLTRGPKGMSVSNEGRVTWTPDKTDSGEEVTAVMTIGDASGQELFHTLRIRVQ